MQKSNISNSVIRRLPRYYRFLGELLNQDIQKISSRELSEKMRLTASQIRQDLNCFGGFGQQGYGYNVAELRRQIGHILGLDQHDKIILIGAGNLGRAITVHIGFQKYGYELAGIFDSNISLENIEISGIKIMHTNRLAEFCKENHPKMAVLCIPKSGAKEMVQKLLDLGVNAFWNFSHYDIHYDHPEAAVENVHLTDSLITLSYAARRQDEYSAEPSSEEENTEGRLCVWRNGMTIKEVSERYGVSQDTLRYYEKAGLVPEVTRTAGGIRDYQPDDLGWLELALCMRSAGLPVSGIVEYRKLFQQGESTIPQRLKLLTDQREELLSMKNQIEQTLNRLNYKISVYERATKTGILSWDEEEKCSGDCDG